VPADPVRELAEGGGEGRGKGIFRITSRVNRQHLIGGGHAYLSYKGIADGASHDITVDSTAMCALANDQGANGF
jgi:hypothetical protein